MPLQFLISAFVTIVIIRTWMRQGRHDLTTREAAGWTCFWLLVLAAVLWRQATDRVAQWFDIERGADLLIFLSIVALFALVSWLLARVGKIEREITTIVRHDALRAGETITRPLTRSAAGHPLPQGRGVGGEGDAGPIRNS